MTKLISFYSVAHSQGKTTCALALANVLVTNGAYVLVLELDDMKPSVARATLITDDLRNTKEYVQNTLQKVNVDIAPYVLTKKELEKTTNRERKEIYNELPDKLDYLVYPVGYDKEDVPLFLEPDYGEGFEAYVETYIKNMIVNLKLSHYDHVIMILPTELESIFGVEVLSHSDRIIHVVTPSSARMYESKKTKEFLFVHAEQVRDKWIDILNMTSPAVSEMDYKKFFPEGEILIHYDEHRQNEELEFRMGSAFINEKMEQVAKRMNIEWQENKPKKRFRFARG